VPAPDAPAKILSLTTRQTGVAPSVLESVADAICFLDAAFCVRYVNPAAEKLAEKPAAELLGRELWRLFPNASSSVFRAQAERAIRDRTVASFEMVSARGRNLMLRLIPNGEGLVLCIADLTQERRLAAQRDSLFSLSRDLIAEFSGGVILRANPSWQRVLGWTQQEVEGTSFGFFTHPDDELRTSAERDRLQKGDVVEHFENRLRCKDGSYRFISWSATYDGVRGYAIGRDATERKNIETRLMVSDRMASVGTLAAGVAHEINNPLAFVLANLDFAAKQLDELAAFGVPESRLAELRSVVGDAREGADRVRSIVRDLKTFSRSDEPKPGPVDLHRVLDSCCSMAWNEIRHRARLEKSYQRGVHHALGTESRLSQIFLNLLVNAAQAIPEGAASANVIRVATGALDDGRLWVSVSDTGPGMAPEVRGRIFEPFFTTKEAGVGTGLGLSICQGIVQGLGGEIRVESELGKGTSFHVVLPAAAPSSRS